MEDIQNNSLLSVTQEEVQKVRETFYIDDAKILQEKLNAVKEWCKKEDHLAEAYQYINRTVLERLLLLSEGSVEITKNKVDKLFTTRGLVSELTLDKSYKEFTKMEEKVTVVPIKRLNPRNQARIMVIQMVHDVFDENNLLDLLRYCIMFGELRLFCDYSLTDMYIIDMKNINENILAKMNPVVLKIAEVLAEAYGFKIKGIYILKAPPFIDRIISIVKQFLKKKIANRLHVISSYEDLHKDVSKKILPEDYGGDAPSLTKLSGQWKDYLYTEEAKKVMNCLNNLVSDESKRSCVKFNEEYLGKPGSFRKLNVD